MAALRRTEDEGNEHKISFASSVGGSHAGFVGELCSLRDCVTNLLDHILRTLLGEGTLGFLCPHSITLETVG